MGADKNESERMKVKMKTKEKGREENENKRNAHARRSNKKIEYKMQFVKINRLVHKLTNSDELADKGLH